MGSVLARKKIGIFDIISTTLLTLLALLTIFPFYNVLILSFANQAVASRRNTYLLPYSFDLSSYKAIFSEPSFLKAFSVTTFITLSGVMISMLVTTMGAYALSKKSCPDGI